MSLASVIAGLPRIQASQKEAMFLLHNRYFCNVQRDTFLKDIGEKKWVILLRDGRDIVGFSTLQVIRLLVDNIERVLLFSGDTIVDQTHWHDSLLAGSFGHVMLRLLAENERSPIYWFLISKGYRTYRFLPVYFNGFYPVFDKTTPAAYARLIQAVAHHKFGAAYDATTGLVRFGGMKDRLRPEMCDVREGRRNDPHIQFFLERNPAYRLGDELACIADISRANLNKYAWRVIENTRVEWNE
jgi:hypothetical protein